MGQRLARERADILIVGRDSEQAWRFAAALHGHVVSTRRLSDTTAAGWRVADRRQQGPGKPGPSWPMRLLPPRFSTLPTIQVQHVPPGALVCPDGSETPVIAWSELVKIDGLMLLFDDAGAGEWADWARALVERLHGRRDARLGGRVACSVAVIDAREPADTPRQRQDELRELSEVLLSHFASVKVTQLSLARDGSLEHEAVVRREIASLVSWELTAIDPLGLEPGLAGALARTPSPALATYTLALWLGVIVAPSVPQRIAAAACAVFNAGRCQAATREAIAEIRDSDLPVVAVAVVISAFIFVLATFLRRRRGTAEESAVRGESRFRRAIGSALLAAWAVALFPRFLLAWCAFVLAKLGVVVGGRVLESALDAADLRVATLLGTLVTSLAVLGTVAVAGRRRPMRLHEARERALAGLRTRRR